MYMDATKFEHGTPASIEANTKEAYFVCPSCNKSFHATISTVVAYSKPIKDNLNEGVIFIPRYICPDCYDIAFEVDKEMVELVKKCRSAGIETFTSCAGHPITRKGDGGVGSVWSPNEEDNRDGTVDFAYPGCMIGIYSDQRLDKLINDALAIEKLNLDSTIEIEKMKDGRIFIYSILMDDGVFWDSIIQEREEALDSLRRNLTNFMNGIIPKYRGYYYNKRRKEGKSK